MEYGYRCAACGRSPKDDAVKLQIDHKIPQILGGDSEPDNLQTLCTACNHDKQAMFKDFKEDFEPLRRAIVLDEVHMRIGELLKAKEGQDVPVALINLVAREENRGDPTKRLRELRQIGWVIVNRKKRDGRRMLSFYRVEHWEPWPEGGPGLAVAKIEHERKLRKAEEMRRRGHAG
ncbi:hypothetical protein BIV57_06470 [Mangrovactinospora gilvigrisea]|uniref:HNH nuclease domain-containing protein n=2 Tax=Mangrovactinospora gilvigrisea TaxID=1428644 RepID=A0A1J7BXT0_9ACTN|nr:hypothetical protein BIV57_06470 [Mangrovactinospora gilvigrisea]